MTLSEFKAWFEGFTDGMEGPPSEKQFKKIKAKVAEISGTSISKTVFIERYRDVWPRYRDAMWNGPIVSYSAGAAPNAMGVGNAVLQGLSEAVSGPEAGRYQAGADQTVEWDPHAALFAAGKVDAAAA